MLADAAVERRPVLAARVGPALRHLPGGAADRPGYARTMVCDEVPELPDDPGELAYLVAASMILDMSDKQQLLAAATVDERLRLEVTLLRREAAWCPGCRCARLSNCRGCRTRRTDAREPAQVSPGLRARSTSATPRRARELRMTGCSVVLEMPGRVLALRGIAAADVAAGQAEPQVHPSGAFPQAIGAALPAGRRRRSCRCRIQVSHRRRLSSPA